MNTKQFNYLNLINPDDSGISFTSGNLSFEIDDESNLSGTGAGAGGGESATDYLNVVVDISHWQKEVNFDDVKNDGIIGVIHKATESTNIIDENYFKRKEECLAKGFLWGSYHYGACNKGGREQAKYYLDTVNPGSNELIVFDYEYNDKRGGAIMPLDEAENFVDQIHNDTQSWCVLYSGIGIKETLIKIRPQNGIVDTLLSKCELWLSQYNSKAVIPPEWSKWTLWQYTDGTFGPEPHEVKGIGGCDRDKFNGTIDELNSFWGIKRDVSNTVVLHQNVPNPFSKLTTITYDLESGTNVKLTVYDINGSEIITLVNEYSSAGSHSVQFDGGNLSSGVYFYRITAGAYSETKKMVLIK